MLAGQAADSNLQRVMQHSERSGQYFVLSDLHWGLGRIRGSRWDRSEDFRRPMAFARFVNQAARDGRRNTLVIGGDWLELTGHLRPDATREQIQQKITEILDGHRIEVTALARAVVQHGLRRGLHRGQSRRADR